VGLCRPQKTHNGPLFLGHTCFLGLRDDGNEEGGKRRRRTMTAMYLSRYWIFSDVTSHILILCNC